MRIAGRSGAQARKPAERPGSALTSRDAQPHLSIIPFPRSYYIVKQLHNIHQSRGPQSDTILERLFELGVVLTASMDAGLAERGLTRARAELLWQLQRQPRRTQRELSQVLRCTPRNVTDLVDTLEASGLVVREPHPTDRRATLVTLTRHGKSEVARMQSGSQAQHSPLPL
jgi:DNA-binding MarR family transcriptional regulator